MSIDRQGARALCMPPQSHADFHLFSGFCLIVVLLCKDSFSSTCMGAMQVVWLHVDFPTIVIDCRNNVAKVFETTLQLDWRRCGCHLIHNVVKAGLHSLRNHASNLAQAMPTLLREALDRLAVLPSHCIVA